MPATVSALSDTQVERLLAATRATIAKLPICWLATRAECGGANARPVRVFAGKFGSDEWTRRILVRRQSRKVREIGQDSFVTLAYQEASGDVYVALGGRAHFVYDRSEMLGLWPDSAAARFPEGFAEANMMLVRVDTGRIEIHARGVTREPFGHGRTLIKRNDAGRWCFVPEHD